MKKALDPFLPILGVVGLIALWYLAVWFRIVDPVLLPSPGDTFQAMYKGMAGGRLSFDFIKTVERTVLSTLIAAGVAIPLGIFLGASERLYRSVEFVVDFFRSTPASAMFPLFLVLFGVGNETKIAVAAFGAALVVLFNVAYGVMNARKTRLLAAKVMGASRMQVLTGVVLLESMPQTFVGLRNGVSLALVIVVVAEMFIGSTDGLGHRVFEAQQLFNMPDMYAAIFAAGALGLRAQSLVFADRAPLRPLVGQIAAMTDFDLSRKSARELARLDQDARRQSARSAERASGRDRADQSEAQRHRDARSGAGVFGRASRRRYHHAWRRRRPAAWVADRDQGHHADRRYSHHVWFATLQGQCADRGRRGGSASQGGRCHRPGEDQHARIRDRRQHGQRAVRGDPQSLESRAFPCRFVGWLGGRCCQRHAAAGAGHRLRLLDPHSGGVLRNRQESGRRPG